MTNVKGINTRIAEKSFERFCQNEKILATSQTLELKLTASFFLFSVNG